jgi:Zn-dependent protease with chaperone function
MLGTDSMIRALRRLKLLSEKTQEFDDGKLAALKISSKKSWLSAFSSHPSIDKRITALEQTYSFIV